MDTPQKVVLSLIGFFVFVGALLVYNGEPDKCYSIEIEFTDGTKRTVQWDSPERPKVTDEGCLYDHSKKSWICGCRDIQFTECNQ